MIIGEKLIPAQPVLGWRFTLKPLSNMLVYQSILLFIWEVGDSIDMWKSKTRVISHEINLKDEKASFAR
jgi:hypothetical protein